MADMKSCDKCKKTYRDYLTYDGDPDLPSRKRLDSMNESRDVYLKIFILADDRCPACLADVLAEVACDIRKGHEPAGVPEKAD